jgi:hypothetical protein
MLALALITSSACSNACSYTFVNKPSNETKSTCTQSRTGLHRR